MKTTAKLLCGVLFPFLLLSTAFSTTYTTLNAGNWEDQLIWSTNGIAPCDCSPISGSSTGEITLSGDKVVINHNVRLGFDLKLENGAEVEISSSGFLNQNQYRIRVEDGSLNSTGRLITSGIENSSNGTFIADNYVLLIGGGVNNAGNMYLNSAVDLIEDQGGASGGTNGSTQIVNGEFFNSGSVVFGSGSCIGLGDNSFTNTSSGSVSGTGYIYTTGNLINDGNWNLTDWCAGYPMGSNASSLPAPNCSRGTCEGPQKLLEVIKPDHKVAVYPNPFMDKFKMAFEFHTIRDGANMRIFDLNGRMVYSRVIVPGEMELTVNPGDLEAGFYLLNIEFPNGEVERIKLNAVR